MSSGIGCQRQICLLPSTRWPICKYTSFCVSIQWPCQHTDHTQMNHTCPAGNDVICFSVVMPMFVDTVNATFFSSVSFHTFAAVFSLFSMAYLSQQCVLYHSAMCTEVLSNKMFFDLIQHISLEHLQSHCCLRYFS